MDNWHLDLLSALIGLAVGALLTLIVGRVRRPAQRAWVIVTERAAYLRRWISAGVEGRYRSEMADYAQTCHLGAGAARLEEIFVSTRLIWPLVEPQPDTGEALPKSQLPYLWPELAAQVAIESPPTLTLAEMIAGSRRIALLAPPGGGKTTTLAFLALACSRPGELADITFAKDRVPFLVHLAEVELEPFSADRPQPAEEPLIRALRDRAGSLTADTLPGVLRRALREGRALLLLDGWDELAPSERPRYTRWIGELSALSPENQFVVSAPLRGYGPLLELEFVPLTLKSWHAAEATQLARRWAAALNATLPTVRASQRPGAEQVPALDFWQAGLTPLDTTLNLWLMLMGESPPTRRVPRFGAAIQQILKPLGTGEINWPLEIGHQVLGRLAREMDQADTRMTTEARLLEAIAEVLSQRQVTTGREVQECQRALGHSSGLLVPRGKDRLTFQCPVFFFYFWAYQLTSSQDTAPARSRLGEPEWALGLSFFAEMTDAGPLIEQLLAAPPDLLHEGVFMAASLVADARREERWKRNVLIRLAQLLIDPNAYLGVRERAATTLVSTQDDGVGYLLRQAISSPDATLRCAAVPGLGALASEIPGRPGDKKALEALLKSLQDPSEDVQRAVVHALAATRNEVALEALIRTLLGAEPPLRQAAAEALARMGEEGHQILREALTEQDILVRRAALSGLVLIDEPWVVDKLEEVMREDSEWLVRSAAEDLLHERLVTEVTRKLEPSQPHDLGWLVTWAAQRGEGVPGGPGASVVLERVLQQGERAAVRAAAARSLGDVGRKHFVEPLTAALKDPARSVREAAFFALALLCRAWNEQLSSG